MTIGSTTTSRCTPPVPSCSLVPATSTARPSPIDARSSSRPTPPNDGRWSHERPGSAACARDRGLRKIERTHDVALEADHVDDATVLDRQDVETDRHVPAARCAQVRAERRLSVRTRGDEVEPTAGPEDA